MVSVNLGSSPSLDTIIYSLSNFVWILTREQKGDQVIVKSLCRSTLVVDTAVWQQEKGLNIMIINTKNIHNNKLNPGIGVPSIYSCMHAYVPSMITVKTVGNSEEQDSVSTLKWSYCYMEDNRNITWSLGES